MSPPLDYDSYRNRHYFPELDGLRAISVLIVLASHMLGFCELIWHHISGHGGVLVFFVLSGFLITTLGLREESERGRLSLTAFYIRRTFRIFPMYYLVLALYGVLIVGFSYSVDTPYLPDFWDHFPWLACYCQEVAVFCRERIQFGAPPFCQAWTLAIEEKFYLAWPLLLFFVCRNLSLSARMGVTIALGLGLGLLGRLLGRSFSGLDACFLGYCYILIGCLVALALHDRVWFERLKALVGPKSLLVYAALLVAAQCALPFSLRYHYRLGDTMCLVFNVLTALVLVGLLLYDGPLQRVLRWRPLVWIGKLSYGIYLVHLAVVYGVFNLMPAARENLGLNLLAFALSCVGSVAVAWVLAVVVERPAIEMGRRLARAARGTAQSQIAVPMPA